MDQFCNRIKKKVRAKGYSPFQTPPRRCLVVAAQAPVCPEILGKEIKAKTRRGGGYQRTVNNNTPAFGETLFRQLEDQTAHLFSDQSLLLF